MQWARKGADQGDDELEYLLGMMLKDGLGVPANPGLARSWLRKAAAQGHADVKQELADLARHKR